MGAREISRLDAQNFLNDRINCLDQCARIWYRTVGDIALSGVDASL
jgi:hypothetical protein